MRRAIEIGAGVIFGGVVGLGIGNAVVQAVHDKDPSPSEKQAVIAAGEPSYDYELRDDVIRIVFGTGGMALTGVGFALYEQDLRQRGRDAVEELILSVQQGTEG